MCDYLNCHRIQSYIYEPYCNEMHMLAAERRALKERVAELEEKIRAVEQKMKEVERRVPKEQ